MLLLAACTTPSPPTLESGLHDASHPSWTVELKAGERLAISALSQTEDLVLTSAGETATSSREAHRAASVRLVASTDGPQTVSVRASGPYSLIRHEPMSGDLCSQLAELVAGGWDLPGVDHPNPDSVRRTRTLVPVMSWARSCSVNRLADLDVGPSCTLSGLTPDDADRQFALLEAEFLDCHHGWTLTDESAEGSREWVAESEAGALHFLRLRDADGARQITAGAMPQ